MKKVMSGFVGLVMLLAAFQGLVTLGGIINPAYAATDAVYVMGRKVSNQKVTDISSTRFDDVVNTVTLAVPATAEVTGWKVVGFGVAEIDDNETTGSATVEGAEVGDYVLAMNNTGGTSDGVVEMAKVTDDDTVVVSVAGDTDIATVECPVLVIRRIE